jgi:hypothetical protein
MVASSDTAVMLEVILWVEIDCAARERERFVEMHKIPVKKLLAVRQSGGDTHRSWVQVPVYIVGMKRSSQCARCATAERLQPERHLVSGIFLRTLTWT